MKRVMLIAVLPLALAACGDQGRHTAWPTNEQRETWAGEDRAKAADRARELEAAALANRTDEWAARDRAEAASRAEHEGTPVRSGSSMDAAPAPGVPQVQLDGSASGSEPPPAPQPTPMGQHH